MNYCSDKFETVVIRPAVCGYSKDKDLTAINILTNLAYHKREISVFGGEQLRPNLHINDMVRAYEYIILSDKDKINGQIFNAGWENQSVNQISKTVKDIVGEDVKIIKSETNDNRSYHISSEKIKKILNFETKFTIENAVNDLKEKFEEKALNNTLSNDLYFNIKRMKNLNLK